MSTPVRHHFIPQFFLKNFADENGKIWMQMNEEGKEPVHIAVENIAFEKHLYTREENGEKNVSNEEMLSKIESIASPIIRKILETKSLDSLTENERYDFAAFIILLSERNPKSFDLVDNMMKQLYVQEWKEGAKKMTDEQIMESYQSVLEKHPEMADVSFEEAKQVILEGPSVENLVPTHSFGLHSMWSAAHEGSGFLLRRKWHLISAPSTTQFVLADDPVLLLFADEEGITLAKGGWGRKSLEIAFPLSPDLLFYSCYEVDSVEKELDINHVTMVNELSKVHANRYFLSKDKPEEQS